MADGNEIDCRFLSDDYFLPLYEAFTEAYSDYVVPFALTETQFRNHISLNAVDLSRSAGCFDNGRIVGFSLNGFGTWYGKRSVYDAGTGVIPERRRQGLSRGMFELMLPGFKSGGLEQFVLEVVTTNFGAIRLYEQLGFRPFRDLALLQLDGRLSDDGRNDIHIREIDEPDWRTLAGFWDGQPSWQNSIDAIERSRPMKRILGAFLGAKEVGYIVFSSKFGRVAQIAVDRNYRQRGIGSALIRAMQRETADGYSMQVINIDKSLGDAVAFFKKLGFYERVSQHEMLLEI